MGALALTFGEHVWLGRGLDDRPSQVLAHELVHVVQQLGGSDGATARRFLPYWEPPEFVSALGRSTGGRDTHRLVLPQISRHAQVFIEAPVPNPGGGVEKAVGYPDIYSARTTIGLYYEGHEKPRRLGSGRWLRLGGQAYAHRSLAAPTVDLGNRVTRVGSAPTTVAVADLKPATGTIQAVEGVAQVGSYVAGIRFAADQVNADPTLPAGDRWDVTAAAMDRTALPAMIPPDLDGRALASSAQPERALVLKQNSRAVRPRTTARGRVGLAVDPVNDGILNYAWVPSAGSLPAIRLPASVRRLGQEVTARLIDPMRRPPTVTGDTRGRGRRHLRVRALVPTARGVAQRTPRDGFDLATWNRDHARLREQAGQPQVREQMREAEPAHLIVQAREGTERVTGPVGPGPDLTLTEAAQTTQAIDFWTSLPASGLARFRSLFGAVFVRVGQAYDRMRTTLADKLGSRSGPRGGGILGSAARVVFLLLRSGARIVLGRTLTLLQTSLVAGVSGKLQALVGAGPIAELQARVAEIGQLREDLESQALQTAEDIVGKVLGPFEQIIGVLDRVQDIVSGLSRVVNLVRWAARAIACVSPPLLGCLWGLAQGLLEELRRPGRRVVLVPGEGQAPHHATGLHPHLPRHPGAEDHRHPARPPARRPARRLRRRADRTGTDRRGPLRHHRRGRDHHGGAAGAASTAGTAGREEVPRLARARPPRRRAQRRSA